MPEPAEIIPIEIREGVLVRIHGIPWDLTEREAAKIIGVIKALANTSPSQAIREG